MYSGEINVFLGTDIRVHILVPQIVKLFYESDITVNTAKYAGIMEKLSVEFLLKNRMSYPFLKIIKKNNFFFYLVYISKQ